MLIVIMIKLLQRMYIQENRGNGGAHAYIHTLVHFTALIREVILFILFCFVFYCNYCCSDFFAWNDFLS